MNLRDLHYADTLARTLHFGEAAKRCHVSQSTLSIQIKKLEEALGVALFERDAKTVRLSEAGLELIPRIRQALEASHAVTNHAQALRDPLAGTVRLGIFPTLAPYLLPHIMPKLTAGLPSMRFELVEEKTESLLDQLLEGTLEAALLALPVDHARLDAIALFGEPFMLAVSTRDALAKKKTLMLNDMQKTEMLLLDEGHCLRAQSLEICDEIGVGESQSYRGTSLETLRHMVASGAGATLMPQLAVRNDPGIAYLPFSDARPQREIALVFRSATARRVLFSRMAREIRAALKPLPMLKLLAATGAPRQSS